jgi:phosphate starvation-inducible protein PhoH
MSATPKKDSKTQNADRAIATLLLSIDQEMSAKVLRHFSDDAVDRIRGIKSVGVITLTKSDIVRHPLVQAIVEAYEKPKKDQY